MTEYKKRLLFRFGLVFFVIVALFGAVLAKIVVLQTIERQDWLRFEQQKKEYTEAIEPTRGAIYDCNGRILAQSILTYSLYMDMRTPFLTNNNGENFHLYIDSISEGLSTILKDKSPQEYKLMLTKGFNQKNGRMRLYKGRVSYTQFKAIKRLPLYRLSQYKSGLISEERHERINPFGSLAHRTVGSIFAQQGTGLCGIEKQYETLLHGKAGKGLRQRISGSNSMITLEEPENGADITTTLDADLQDVVESELRKTLAVTGGDWGCCILMETHSGEIKAISNLDRNSDGNYSERENHAVVRMEPGSMFKTFSLMASLDDGKVSLTDTFHVQPGGWVYQDARHPINDSHYIDDLHGQMTVKQGLTTSSNIVLAKVVTSSYDRKAEKFVGKLEQMGLLDTFQCEIPGSMKPKIQVPKDRESLARMSFGYVVELPPIYTLAFYNAIANDGKLIAPYLVKSISREGTELETFETHTIKSNMCSHSTLKQVQECLESVVWDSLGTASARGWSNKAQSKKVHLAGKTGTARVLSNGTYLNNRHRIAFCGYFPTEHPQYTCICIIHNVQGRDAGMDCGGTVRRIAERTMAHTAVNVTKAPKDSLLRPNIKKGWQRDLRIAARELDIDVPRMRCDWTRVNEEGKTEEININTNLVPNVVGMGAKDAIYAIERTGMFASITGKGRVVSQSVQNGSTPIKGGTVYLELR